MRKQVPFVKGKLFQAILSQGKAFVSWIAAGKGKLLQASFCKPMHLAVDEACILSQGHSFCKVLWHSNALLQGFPRRTFCKGYPFPRAGTSIATQDLLQGQTRALLQGSPFARPLSQGSLEVSSLKPGLVYRRCKRILYLGASCWLSFVALTPIDTLCVRVEMCPTKSSALKHQWNLVLIYQASFARCKKLWCLLTMWNDFLSLSLDHASSHWYSDMHCCAFCHAFLYSDLVRKRPASSQI